MSFLHVPNWIAISENDRGTSNKQKKKEKENKIDTYMNNNKNNNLTREIIIDE